MAMLIAGEGQQMNLSEIIKHKKDDIVTTHRQTTLRDAATMLARQGIGVLVVLDEDDSVIGILSERDITRAVSNHLSQLASLTVGEQMSTEVVVCEITEHPSTAIWLMAEYGVRHLPVTRNGKLEGIVSSRDVLRLMSDLPDDGKLSLWRDVA